MFSFCFFTTANLNPIVLIRFQIVEQSKLCGSLGLRSQEFLERKERRVPARSESSSSSSSSQQVAGVESIEVGTGSNRHPRSHPARLSCILCAPSALALFNPENPPRYSSFLATNHSKPQGTFTVPGNLLLLYRTSRGLLGLPSQFLDANFLCILLSH